MKKLLLIPFLFLFAACPGKKDDQGEFPNISPLSKEEQAELNRKLIGRWKCDDPAESILEEYLSFSEKMIFTEEVREKYGVGFTLSGPYQLDVGKIYYSINKVDPTLYWSYSVSATTLIVNDKFYSKTDD